MRVGLIDNLGKNYSDIKNSLSTASAEQILEATGGNTGNVAYVLGAKKILGNDVSRVCWGDNYANIKKNYDVLVICCANQIGGHTDLHLWGEMLDALKLPVVLLGLGAQSDSSDTKPNVSAGTEKFLKVVSSLRPNPKFPNIATRGLYSSEVLYSLGYQSVPLTCPSLFISPAQDLGLRIASNQKKSKAYSLCVMGGNPFDDKISNIEARLNELVDRFNGSLLIQHPLELVQLGLGERESIEARTINMLKTKFKAKNTLELFDWFVSKSFISIDAEEWMFNLRKFSAFVGPRFHGVALGVQSEFPGTVVCIDSRTTELCKSSGIRGISPDELLKISFKDLEKKLRWTKSECQKFDKNRSDMAKDCCNFLTKNNINPSEHLKELRT